MSLHWYACISTNTYCFETHHISLETNWWALSNASSIMQICLTVHEILADKAFTATDGLISQSFVVTFVHPTHMQIALIWGFPVQLSLWKSVHWLWRYKLNEVCDRCLGRWGHWKWVHLILRDYGRTRGRSFLLFPRVRLESLFLCLPCMVVFVVMFPVVVIDSHC